MKELAARKKGFGIVRTKVSVLINAPQEIVTSAYRDYKNWNKLFPATIQDAKLIKDNSLTQTVEVDHKKAGAVINILHFLSADEIELKEFKPLYNAVFLNRFYAVNANTEYIVDATIFLKSFFKILAPFIKALVNKRIKNYVLLPMKTFAEKRSKVEL